MRALYCFVVAGRTLQLFPPSFIRNELTLWLLSGTEAAQGRFLQLYILDDAWLCHNYVPFSTILSFDPNWKQIW